MSERVSPTCSAVFIILLILAIIGYLILVLICISLMTNDVEHFFMYLLAVYIFPFVKCLVKLLGQFLNWAVCVLLLSCRNCLDMLNTIPLLETGVAKIFSLSVTCFFFVLVVYFNGQKFFILMKIILTF